MIGDSEDEEENDAISWWLKIKTKKNSCTDFEPKLGVQLKHK